MNDTPIQTTTLDNGLTIAKINLPNFHTVTNFLVIRSGSRYEQPRINGIAHFLEHMVFKGTKSFSNPKEIAETIEGIGGYFNAWTSNDHTAYWNVVPADQWQVGMKVAAELAFFPTLPADDMERERGVIIEEIRRMNDDPASKVDDLVGGILFPDNPLGYSVIGTEDIIRSVSIEDFKNYHQTHYLPNQATFVVAGNLEGKDVDGEIEKLLGELKSGQKTLPTPVTGPSQKALKVLNKKTDQTHFIMAVSDPRLHLSADDRYVASVLNAVLGWGMSSRLFMNIREKKGLAYSIHSYFQPFEDTGVIQVYGGINTDKISLALEALNEELERLRTELVEESELKKAIAKVVGSFDLSADKPVDMATWYGTSWLLAGKGETYAQAQEKLKRVKAEQVLALAKDVFAKDRQTLSVIGPFDDEAIFYPFLQIK